MFYVVQHLQSDPVNKAEKIHSDTHWSFTAENYQQALRRFGEIIQPFMEKNNEWHFGLIGNRRLLLTTPGLANFLSLPGGQENDDLKKIPYASPGNELIIDKTSQMILSYGLEKNLIDWPAGTVSIDDPSSYYMIVHNNYTKKVQPIIKLEHMNEEEAIKAFDTKCRNYRAWRNYYSYYYYRFDGILVRGNGQWIKQSGQQNKNGHYFYAYKIAAKFVQVNHKQ